ncbi:MAG TPA: isoprenyl transferase [Clostridiaceae bacterium]|nr:isoprenyl transferase [Clostridiaceae bacterium]
MILRKLFKRKKVQLDKSKLPLHIAIIPDGNGRWAKRRGMPRSAGHREGAKTLKKIVKFCAQLGIKYMTIYVFSTENWKRPKSEVDDLMSLLLEFLRNAEAELEGSNVRIKVIGRIEDLSDELQKEIRRVEKHTDGNTGLCLNIALNYGGRDEIVSAVKKIAKEVAEGRLNPDEIDESVVSSRLYTCKIPDPDLLIRTSGEKRSSNFLLWQLAYTEFWYTNVLWPDFTENNMIEALQSFQNRNRRFGGI